MSRDQKNTSVGTVAIAALVGGAAGALVSLMFAPKSGRALRQDILNKTEGIIEQAEGIFERVEDTTFQRVESIKQRSTELVEKGKVLKEDIQIFIQDLKLTNPSYIDITQSVPGEDSPQPETETDSPDFAPTEIPPQEETPTV